MTERRYDDQEISAIFAKAVERPEQLPPQTTGAVGLSLGELQQIGREVGIPPDAIADAARSLDSRPAQPPRRLLGLPVRVERSVDLGRWLTEAEWEQLVVRLREVFDARCSVSAHGNFRQWTNGNLQALLEPTPTGHRLRLRTTRQATLAGVRVGLAALGMAGLVSIASAASHHLARSLPGVLMMGLMGAGMMAYSALPVPGWARRRARQMEGIAASLMAPADESEKTESPSSPA